MESSTISANHIAQAIRTGVRGLIARAQGGGTETTDAKEIQPQQELAWIEAPAEPATGNTPSADPEPTEPGSEPPPSHPDLAAIDALPAPATKVPEEALNLGRSEIMMAFESLGGAGHGWEFGMVQRELGAEPLGLLRFADLAPDLLIAALNRGFEGVGEPENTVVFVPEHSKDQYWSRDRRFWMAQGCHIGIGEMSVGEATAIICRRHRFLREKLLTALKEGSKIFVYKSSVRTLNDEQLRGLHGAVRLFGKSALLYVRVEDATHPNGYGGAGRSWSNDWIYRSLHTFTH